MAEGRTRTATTSDGKEFAFDGTGDVGDFHKEFVRSMKEFQLGTIVNEGNHGIPMRPEDAFIELRFRIGQIPEISAIFLPTTEIMLTIQINVMLF